MRLKGPALLVASLTLSLGCASASYADETSTTPPGTTLTIPADAGDAGGLSKEELQRQVARAEALRAEIVAGGAGIEAALAKVESAAKKANAALEAYSKSASAGREAREKAASQAEIAKALQERLNEARAELREWAVSAWTQGGPLAEQLGYLDALSKEASEASNPLQDLSYLTGNRIRSVDDIREVTVAQKLASMTAEHESAKAQAAEAKAKKQKEAAQKLVEAQQDALGELRSVHAERVSEAGPLAGLLMGSGDGDATAAAERLTDALEASNVSIKDLRLTPCTQERGTFPNGQIPPSHLCPMVGSTDEFLIPEAAAAFNAMSKAFAKDTGQLICVTDGYRSFAEQVAVKAARGPWAATPGTSEHGLGKAVDLCGGVQDYSQPAHLWLVHNAALFGWYHPSWAAQGGKLPEPWHWEYVG